MDLSDDLRPRGGRTESGMSVKESITALAVITDQSADTSAVVQPSMPRLQVAFAMPGVLEIPTLQKHEKHCDRLDIDVVLRDATAQILDQCQSNFYPSSTANG